MTAGKASAWKYDPEKALEATRAAGYCGLPRPQGGGSCTRPPGHDGEHVDHYNGRPGPGATEGYRWPQIKDSRRA